MLRPQTETEAQGTIYARTAGERLPYCGGDWDNGSDAGLGALNLNNPRSNSNTNIGFRPALEVSQKLQGQGFADSAPSKGWLIPGQAPKHEQAPVV